jgi:hypothetical protein
MHFRSEFRPEKSEIDKFYNLNANLTSGVLAQF